MAQNSNEKTKPASKKAGGNKAQKSYEFQAEVSKLLQLMVHSVYSEQDVFLRELVSNASDALDKLRYQALQDESLMEGDGELKITIVPDAKAGTITITDNGIGMDENELVDNLGTIARSGTQAFMEQAKANADGGDANLIGQFGVGFYAAFMVAEKVDVLSRKAGADAAFKWSSDGTGGFEITALKSDDAPHRGSKIILYLRKDAAEFSEAARLEHIIRSYSDHVPHPIMLQNDDELKQVNAASAIWMRPKSELTDDDYNEFFNHVSGSFGAPSLTVHYKAEGRHEYNVLLFVPEMAPFDLFDPERRGRQKLYVRRVFITDDAQLLPSYLRFVRGVIDSEDMPLNISREMLQNNPIVGTIRQAVTKRILSELKKCAEKTPQDYEKLWVTYGPVIKEGLYEDSARRDELFELVRFRTTHGGDWVSLKDYVGRLKENQTAIYYLAGDNARDLAASPQLEGYKARGVEVLLLSDPVDSFWVRSALGYDGKPFKSVTQGNADLDAIALSEEADKPKADQQTMAPLMAALKTALGERVQDVRASSRLTTSPVCLVAGEGGLDRSLERILSQQKSETDGLSAPVLEVNAGHPLIVSLGEKLNANNDEKLVQDIAGLLLDQAYILEGEVVRDGQDFARRMNDIVVRALG